MGRSKLIEKTAAVRIAMNIFWKNGYNQSSVEDLQNAMGLQRGSFYFYFKDKSSLFLEVLELYRDEIVSVRKQAVLKSKTTKAGIRKFFNMLLDHNLKDKGCPGCLNTNTATELGSTDEKVSRYLTDGMVRWEKFWFDYLKNGQSKGEISPKLNIKVAARQLVLLTQGINVIGKVRPDKTYLAGMIKASLHFLEES